MTFFAISLQMNVEFNSFDIVEHRDYVYIYDGADTDAELLAEYSGTTLPDSVSSTGGSITVRFTSYKTHSFFNGYVSWLLRVLNVTLNINRETQRYSKILYR